jgi:enoyl-CoA hydratase/carnithine racemase
MTDHILVERPEAYPGVQVIRFNRPEKKNAFTRDMYARMIDALHTANGEERIRVTAFLGTDGCFSAGNDVADFLAVAMGGDMGTEVLDFLAALVHSEKPLVSGVDGLAVGIGTTLNLHCDLTLATPRSLFKTPFVDLGLVPEAGSSLIVPNVAGHQRAFALLAAGEGFSAEEAHAAGLIWKIVPEAEIEAATLATAGKLATKPPEALKITRALLRGDKTALSRRIHEEARHFGERLRSAEARAAFEAFKRR